MPLHLTVKFGESFEIMNGDKCLRIYINDRPGKGRCVQVTLDGPMEFEISRVIKAESSLLSSGVRKKIQDEPHRED